MSETFNSRLKTEISGWIDQVFGVGFTIEIEGNTEKGAGYLGDIVFVKIQKQEITKRLVLKCSKRSAALREKIPVSEAFKNEIYIYKTVLQAFKNFETEHSVAANKFDNFPMFFGSILADNVEVIILENLKARNYFLHDRHVAMSRKYIELILNAYGYFHALSAAFRDQQPEKFENLSGNLVKCWNDFRKSCDFDTMYRSGIDQIYDSLADKIPENVRNEWKKFGEHVKETLNLVVENNDRFNVIAHVDCWNNNFMFQGTESDPNHVAILDWQISSLSTPIIDLSYFLFTCLSKDDLKNIPDYLKVYYDSFARTIRKLGSDPERIYTFDQLNEDWKKFSRFGIMMAAVIIKVAMTDKEDCHDLEEMVEKGSEISDIVNAKMNHEKEYLDRMKALVQYAFDNELIKIGI